MKYFYSTLYLDGKQKNKFPLSLFQKYTKPTIEAISICIISENDFQYYAVSKDFNFKEAWNRYQWGIRDINPHKARQSGMTETMGKLAATPVKKYWIRENILQPIFLDMLKMAGIYGDERNYWEFTYNNFKRLINKYGKTNELISKEIEEFTTLVNVKTGKHIDFNKKEFYTDMAAYQQVAFCSIFGGKNNMPFNLLRYSIDMREKIEYLKSINKAIRLNNRPLYFPQIEHHPEFPKSKEYHALLIAKKNKELYEFLNKL